MQVWQEYQDEHPEMFDIIEAGIDTLYDYYERSYNHSAYIVAMSEYLYLFYSYFSDYILKL